LADRRRVANVVEVALAAGVLVAVAVTILTPSTLIPSRATAIRPVATDEPDRGAGDALVWKRQRPAHAQDYAGSTLARFEQLLEGHGWSTPAWNQQGTLTAVHLRTGLAFVLVPAGRFMMGSIRERSWYSRPVHAVSVPAFMLCETECTLDAWRRVVSVGKGSRGSGALPAVTPEWGEASAWCSKVGLRLPSEAEWEYACRAGSKGPWCFGDDESLLHSYAWYLVNSGKTQLPVNTKFDEEKVLGMWGCARHEVGMLESNAFGLSDMHGNVAEWCQDAFHLSYEGAPVDGGPRLRDGKEAHAIRGGCWGDPGWLVRSACRFSYSGGDLSPNTLGFRPATDLPR
jgi:formylglycine-generating enzyme required for sulfatase activity